MAAEVEDREAKWRLERIAADYAKLAAIAANLGKSERHRDWTGAHVV